MAFKVIDRNWGVDAIRMQIRDAEEDIESLKRHIQKLRDLLREKLTADAANRNIND